MEFITQIIESYGYLGIFLMNILDHTGTPGGVMLGMSMATTGVLNFWPTLIVSFIGGVVGDLLLYAVGVFGGQPLVDYLERKKPKTRAAFDKATSWLNRYGSAAVIWGRFVAVVGRYISLIVGALKYKFFPFLMFSALGNTVMMLLFGLPTYFAGDALNAWANNPWFMFYVTLVIMVGQIVLTGMWVGVKKHRKKRAQRKKKLEIQELDSSTAVTELEEVGLGEEVA